MRVLVVEDETNLRNMIGRRLGEAGLTVDPVGDAEEAWKRVTNVPYDCTIIDVRLPGKNGFDLLRDIRNNRISSPVLFLTALDAVEDRVRGLDLGADDYLVKPFAFDELIARVRALLRRRTGPESNMLTYDDLRVDIRSRQVTRGEEEIPLTTKEFAVLEYLLRNCGQVLSRTQIIDHVWRYNFDYDTNIIDVYIRYLRRKLDDPFDRKLIHTVRGIGYVLR